jgi:phosphatidylglycerophosphatase C
MTEPTGSPVSAPAPTTVAVAAFDFDGTLTEGGSMFPFFVSLRGFWVLAGAVVRQSPGLLRAAVAGGTAADDTKEKLFIRLLGGLPATEVDRVSAAFAARHLDHKLRAQTARRLRWHQAQGHHVVIVSASPECYVGPAGVRLGVDGTVATRLAIDADGLLSGRYDGKNCRGAEKVSRLMAYLQDRGLAPEGVERPVLWAYGNSRGDLRLLQAADHGVDAGKLGRWGRLRGFPRLADLGGESARPTS